MSVTWLQCVFCWSESFESSPKTCSLADLQSIVNGLGLKKWTSNYVCTFLISIPDLQLKFKVVSNGDSMHTYHIHVLQLLHSPLKARRVTSITPSNFNQAVAMLD